MLLNSLKPVGGGNYLTNSLTHASPLLNRHQKSDNKLAKVKRTLKTCQMLFVSIYFITTYLPHALLWIQLKHTPFNFQISQYYVQHNATMMSDNIYLRNTLHVCLLNDKIKTWQYQSICMHIIFMNIVNNTSEPSMIFLFTRSRLNRTINISTNIQQYIYNDTLHNTITEEKSMENKRY